MSRKQGTLDARSRREFVTGAARSLLGLGTLAFVPGSILADSKSAPSKGGTAKRVIYLYMSGGMTHLDTFDTKPGRKPRDLVNRSRLRHRGCRSASIFRRWPSKCTT